MSPIAATDAELENNLDAVVAETLRAPRNKTIRPCANMRRSFESQVRGIVINGPHIDDLLVLARTGEEVEFNAIWFINELDEPVEKMSFKAPLNSIEWSLKRSNIVIRTDSCDFSYYPERIGEIFCYDEGIVPEALQSYGDYLPVPRDGRDD